jgi:hypothetical protein
MLSMPLCLYCRYLLYRSMFTLNGGWWYLYSLPVLGAELFSFLAALPLLVCYWHQADRLPRKLSDCVPQLEQYPSVDVIVVGGFPSMACGIDSLSLE